MAGKNNFLWPAQPPARPLFFPHTLTDCHAPPFVLCFSCPAANLPTLQRRIRRRCSVPVGTAALHRECPLLSHCRGVGNRAAVAQAWPHSEVRTLTESKPMRCLAVTQRCLLSGQYHDTYTVLKERRRMQIYLKTAGPIPFQA